jgi:hypothetical protein
VAFLVCFDDDTATNPAKLPAGQNAASALTDRLAQYYRPVLNLMPPTGIKDINAWWQHNPDAVTASLTRIADEYALTAPTSPLLTLAAAAAPDPAW